eukprot:3703049-Prymnesium_polylepis.2
MAVELARAMRCYKLWPGEKTITMSAVVSAREEGWLSEQSERSMHLNSSELFLNYAHMKAALHGFNASFKGFFFFAEFILVLVVIVLSVASYHEVSLSASVAADDAERPIAIFRVLTVFGSLSFFFSLVCCLLLHAAALTSSAHSVRDRTHALIMELGTKKNIELLEEVSSKPRCRGSDSGLANS